MTALPSGAVPVRRDFFDLQLRLARRVAAISGLPLERAILDYTNVYVRLAIGRDFDAGHPVWREYVAGLNGGGDAVDWTWRFFLTRPASAPPGLVATFGCFSYARDSTVEGADRIHLHFGNNDPAPGSPLAEARVATRREELRALFAHVQQSQPDVRRVAGLSWLYHLPAYRRLFPESYLATARVAANKFRNMPLWGQFLDRHGHVKPAEAGILHDRLACQTTLDNLAQCFPLQPLAVEAPAAVFYRLL